MIETSYGEGLDARGREILEAVEPTAKSLYGAHAVLELAAEPEAAAQRVEEIVRGRLGIGGDGAFVHVAMGTFDAFAAMLLYCRWEDRLTDATKQHIRQVMTEGVHHRGNTENHWLMYYTAQYLAADRFGAEGCAWNGLPHAVVGAEAKRWLLGMIDRTSRFGHHEYDSTGYHGWHVMPMVALADHAPDEYVRRQAGNAATLYIADIALEYFKGGWAGGHSREGYRENTWTLIGSSATLCYYYLGAPTLDPMHVQESMCMAATATYRPPAMLASIASDRSAPRVVKKTKAPRTIYRHVDRESQPVRKYTYTTSAFALGTTQLGLPGAPAGPIDLISWDLTWEGPKHEAKIVCNHPYLNAGRFSAFLSELPQAVGRNVPTPKPYLQDPDRFFGASPYEQLMQHEGAAIILYRIPEDDLTPYLNLYLPRSMDWHASGAWIRGDAGAFVVVLRPIGDVRWERIQQDSHVDGWLVRIQGHDVGLIIEAAESESRERLPEPTSELEERVDLRQWPRDGRVGYRTSDGHALAMTYDGAHVVDGAAIDYANWPLYGAPEAHAEMNTGIVSFEYGGETVALDFGVDPEAAPIPMRVIG